MSKRISKVYRINKSSFVCIELLSLSIGACANKGEIKLINKLYEHKKQVENRIPCCTTPGCGRKTER